MVGKPACTVRRPRRTVVPGCRGAGRAAAQGSHRRTRHRTQCPRTHLYYKTSITRSKHCPCTTA